jgi:molecular chaperone HscC
MHVWPWQVFAETDQALAKRKGFPSDEPGQQANGESMLVGIDLGTTNSAIGIWQDGTAKLIPNALGDLLTPSAVAIRKDGTMATGAAALSRMAMPGEAVATSFKRHMGTDHRVRLHQQSFTAEELSALILRALCDDVAAATGTRPDSAVITVPAYFNDRQRRATRRAGELAGLTVRRLVNEPTAAAIAFGLMDRQEREPFLVFDLGGGTFDVSIVEMFAGIIEVRASAGDNRLGGDDFNDALVAAVRAQVDPDGLLRKAAHGEKLLFEAAERTRRALSDSATAEFAVTVGERRLSTTVTEDAFEAAVAPLLARLRDPLARALRDSAIRADSLSDVVLVGGSTRMPVVRRAITRLFGRFPNARVHPDQAVALGAAMQAGLIERSGGLEEIRITDVCPFTLGVDHATHDAMGGIQRGLFSPIIERNTPVPVSRVQTYNTISDNQRKLKFGIFQGEAREVSGNIKLGEVDIDVPPHPAGHVSCDVRFSYDSSGLLEVDVSVPITGATRNLLIIDEEDRRAIGDLGQRRKALAALKVHPREDAASQALLARGERAYEDHLGAARTVIGQWVMAFAAALDSQDPRAIADAARVLEANLAQLENGAPL